MKWLYRLLSMVFFVGIFVIGGLFLAGKVEAEITHEIEPRVLVVHPEAKGEIGEYTRMLDMHIAHFTTNITFKNTKDVEAVDLRDTTHLVYFGYKKEKIPEAFQQLVKNFDGTVLALSRNVEQLGDRFSFINTGHEEVFTKIELTGEQENEISVFPHTVINVNIGDESEILAQVTHGPSNAYPLFIKRENSFYYSALTIEPPLSPVFGEVLHEVFEQNHTNIKTGYIRLEDVHPKVNAEYVYEIAKVLRDKDLPYMIAVVPVYTDPESKEEYYLSDSPDLLKALRFAQSNGGSVVLHGYTHQFRNSETGEGFEFWDVKHNMPIYHTQDEEVEKKTERDFQTKEAFESYRKEQKEFEANYVRKKLNRGIQELANYGIYPLAFEAPHYTMSQNGYAVASEFFSTYVGQIQLSDQDWEIMNTAPYISKPTFLNGMELLPETLGYVDPNDPNAIEKMIKEAKNYSLVRDGMIAGFYHPYLGVDRFKELIYELEKIPNVEWIDLKKRDNAVKADYVEIHSSNGEITANIEKFKLYKSSLDFPLFHFKELIRNITWGMVGAGALAVLLFIIYTINSKRKFNRFKRYKRRGYIG